jgi:hypothetical protein
VIEPGVLYLVANDGLTYRLPTDVETLKSEAPVNWKVQIPPLRAVQPWPGGEIALGVDGRVSILSYRTRKWTSAAGSPSAPVSDLLAPFYWSKRLKEL